MKPTSPTAKDCSAASPTTWRGRQALRIANGSVSLSVLARGGVLAEFGFVDASGSVPENALWEAPWLGEALPQTDAEIERAYGDLGAGRFLNRYTGHALCLDGFGSATNEEVQAGSGLHGEATLADWQFESCGAASATARAQLPLAQLAVERHFSMHAGETIVRIDERITNLAQCSRALHWVQHATIGLPLFDEASVVSASVSKSVTWPFVYEGVPLLATNMHFTWPDAPKSEGGSLDLSRLFAVPGTGFVAAARQRDEVPFGFVSVLHPARQVVLIYLFPARIFPWVAFWEENRCRREWPWSGRAQARGLEFGTTPLPLGSSEVDAAGPLYDTPVSHLLDAGATVCAPWMMALVQVPSGGTSIQEITVGRDALLIHNEGRTIEFTALGIEAFLSGAGESA
jgi:hypothetical protein